MKIKPLDWPLMVDNITDEDRQALIEFLGKPRRLTQGEKVEEFEAAWSKWLGVSYSVFVNSGSSANLISLVAMNFFHASGDVIVPPLTWVSDVTALYWSRNRALFVDINLQTLGLDEEKVWKKIITSFDIKAVFITHVMGLSAFVSQDFIDALRARNIFLIEDCSEAHGATFQGKKLGTIGELSNFSFYYAHHMSTIEGGMVCTDNELMYETLRALRGHGMIREMKNTSFKDQLLKDLPNKLRPEFVFLYPGFNVRSTELNAVLGLSQLKRLDENNQKRKENFALFLKGLNPSKFITELRTEGSVNYAFTLIMRSPLIALRNRIERLFDLCQVEFRRGLSGGGNQLRQPYLAPQMWKSSDFPIVEHLSDFSWYIGNYPGLSHEKIAQLTELLNAV